MKNSICIQGVTFKRINEKSFAKINLSNMLFFMMSQSGAIDRRGIIYLFAPTATFFMNKEDYNDGFIDKLLLSVSKWNLVNVYFCDFLIVRPDIYDSFAHELCARNIRDFWFETAIDVYKSKYCK